MLRRGMWAHRFPGSGGKVGGHLGRALLPGSSSRTGIQSTGSTRRWGLDLLDLCLVQGHLWGWTEDRERRLDWGRDTVARGPWPVTLSVMWGTDPSLTQVL